MLFFLGKIAFHKSLFFVPKLCKPFYFSSHTFNDKWQLQKFCLEGLLKNLNEKKINKKIEDLDKLSYWYNFFFFLSFTISFYKSSNFKLSYDSLLWVFIAIVGSYDHLILLSLSNVFIFMQLLLSICLCLYKNILN